MNLYVGSVVVFFALFFIEGSQRTEFIKDKKIQSLLKENKMIFDNLPDGMILYNQEESE